MICRNGYIRGTDGELAEIVLQSSAACGRCQQGRGCGLALFSRWFSTDPDTLLVANPEHHAVGQRVRLELAPGALLIASLFSYGLPLAGLLLGIAAGAWLAGELGAAAGAAIGLAVGLGLLRGHRPRLRLTVTAVE